MQRLSDDAEKMFSFIYAHNSGNKELFSSSGQEADYPKDIDRNSTLTELEDKGYCQVLKKYERAGFSCKVKWYKVKEYFQELDKSVHAQADCDMENLVRFLSESIRSAFHHQPENEKYVQNIIESLLIGKRLKKGIDYDRESGKFTFSGREYIPDFIIPNLNLCIEVKLVRTGKKSKIIEEISADVTAYSKQYERQIFVVYDLGGIRDEMEFKRDIEQSRDNIKVIIIKH